MYMILQEIKFKLRVGIENAAASVHFLIQMKSQIRLVHRKESLPSKYTHKKDMATVEKIWVTSLAAWHI